MAHKKSSQKNDDAIVIKVDGKDGMVNFGGVDLPYMTVMRVLSSPEMKDRKIDMQGFEGGREQMTAGEFIKKLDEKIDRVLDKAFDPKNDAQVEMIHRLARVMGVDLSDPEVKEAMNKILPLEREAMRARIHGDTTKAKDIQKEIDNKFAARQHDHASGEVNSSQFWEQPPASAPKTQEPKPAPKAPGAEPKPKFTNI